MGGNKIPPRSDCNQEDQVPAPAQVSLAVPGVGLWHGCDSPPQRPVPPQEYTMLCLLCGRAEDSISILPDDPRQMTPLF